MHLEKLTAAWLVRSSEPKSRRLADLLRDAIRSGEICNGVRLPSERDLARQLGVSRTTVLKAYRQLRAEALLDGVRGGGTRVAARTGLGGSIPSFALSHKSVDGPTPGMIDLSTSIVDDAISALEVPLTGHDVAGLARLGYLPLGLPELRTALAVRYSEAGLPTTAGNLLVTTGAQQSLSLLCRLFGGVGAAVLVETPTYAGALDSIRATGATAIGVPTDGEGMMPAALFVAIQRHPVRLIYLMSTCHNPTGRTTGSLRRRDLHEIARSAGIPVVDDAAMAGLAPVVQQPAGPTPHADIIVGSVSKILWPGLRVGWIRASTRLIARLARLKVTDDLGSAHASQLLTVRLLPQLDQIAARRRALLDDRRALLLDLLDKRLPDWDVPAPAAGMFIWARLPAGDSTTLCGIALTHGVRVMPGSRATADYNIANNLRISCGETVENLRAGVDRLAHAWADYQSLHRPDEVADTVGRHPLRERRASAFPTETLDNLH